ncbi:MAG: IPT/TIG domain-containing protein, partial [Acidimicrobiales bacterium]
GGQAGVLVPAGSPAALASAVGGTSAAAPLWAAMVALTEASGGGSGCDGRRVGFLNPALYGVASSKAGYAASFDDIVRGNNDYRPSGYTGGEFKALPGFDMASGLGTPVATAASGAGLASRLCSLLRTPSPIGIDAVLPGSGRAAGGNRVTIIGYGFAKVTKVFFGSRRCLSFSVVDSKRSSPTEISAVAPPGSGTVTIRVLKGTAESPATISSRYTYTG